MRRLGMAADDTSEHCTWCGAAVEGDDGYRLAEQPGARHAVFCRLEHVVPWAIQGAHWEAGETDAVEEQAQRCAQCEATVGEVGLLLVRHRGAHRILDGFCSVDHLRAWAVAGGRW